jgi:hypothetical protein
VADYLQAVQKLTPKGLIQRQAMCPEHQIKSSEFKSITEKEIDGRNRTMWVFSCKYLGTKQKHIFLAFPDRSAPKIMEQMNFWKEEQALSRIGESQKKWQ